MISSSDKALYKPSLQIKKDWWLFSKNKVDIEVQNAEETGNSPSKVVEYYQNKATQSIKGFDNNFEEFYLKVKDILSSIGEVSDIIGRLTDKEYFATLSYEQRQKYTFELSEKYLKAKNRYYNEIKFEKSL